LIGRLGFGSRLRSHRERRGISLRTIAESTKIKHSLLEALERGDVSQWPRGLFRRAYLRDYANAVGLAPEPLLAEFLQLFPEDGIADLPETAPAPMRLTFDLPPSAPVRRVGVRALISVAELGVVCVIGTAAAFATGAQALTACGVVALAYYPLATAMADRRQAVREWLSMLRGWFKPAAPIEADAESARLYLVGRQRAAAEPMSLGADGDELVHTRSASR
jgi:transcriptional regulator with XRE-family HTH domain